MRRRELFEDLLRPTKPVAADVYRELTMFFYGLSIFLIFLLSALGVDLPVVLGIVLIPLVLALITMARRFTAIGWSPWWMLVAWPISALLWVPLMASEGDEADSSVSGLLSRWRIDPSSATPRSLIRRQVIVVLIYGASIVVVAVVGAFFSR